MKSDFSEWITALSRDPFFVAIATIIAFIIIVSLKTWPASAKKQKGKTCVLCRGRGWHTSLESPKARAAREEHGGFVCPPCRNKTPAKILIFPGRK